MNALHCTQWAMFLPPLAPLVCAPLPLFYSSSSSIPIRSEQTRVVLTSAAYVHLKQEEISKYTRNLAPASRAILLSGPAGTLSSIGTQLIQLFFSAITDLRPEVLLSWRALPADACQGTCPLFSSKVTLARSYWFSYKGQFVWNVTPFVHKLYWFL